MQTYTFHQPTNNKAEANAANRLSQKITDQKIFWILKVGIIISIPLFVWYILLANAISTKGFLLAQAKQEQANLQLEIEKIDIDLTIPVSLYALESLEQVQEMTTITKQNFVEIKDSEIAFVDSKNFK